mmetsp:Transcript_42669/g.118825  ORF Transcript_42669/g.118825 Transcript_42669/m.118825 type:complete len:306 (-) Transcript_42669:647-1564(-)
MPRDGQRCHIHCDRGGVLWGMGRPASRPPSKDFPGVDRLPAVVAPTILLREQVLQHALVGWPPQLEVVLPDVSQGLRPQPAHLGCALLGLQALPQHLVVGLAQVEVGRRGVGVPAEASAAGLCRSPEAAQLQQAVPQGEVGLLEVWVQRHGLQQAPGAGLELSGVVVAPPLDVVGRRTCGQPPERRVDLGHRVEQRQPATPRQLLVLLHQAAHGQVALYVGERRALRHVAGRGCLRRGDQALGEVQEVFGVPHLIPPHGGRRARQQEGADRGRRPVAVHEAHRVDGTADADDAQQRGRQHRVDLL